MGVKRPSGGGKGPQQGEEARAHKEKAAKARRHARILMGSPPPGQALTPKRLKPPKHKKPPGQEDS